MLFPRPLNPPIKQKNQSPHPHAIIPAKWAENVPKSGHCNKNITPQIKVAKCGSIFVGMTQVILSGLFAPIDTCNNYINNLAELRCAFHS